MSNHTSDELDLHEYTVAEAIEKFVQCYNTRVKNNQLGCWKIIHGYGSTGAGGVIRSKLRSFLNQHLDKLKYESGDQFGNPGWTWVYPKAKLPDYRERIALEIIQLCTDAKSEEKILREFAAARLTLLCQMAGAEVVGVQRLAA